MRVRLIALTSLLLVGASSFAAAASAQSSPTVDVFKPDGSLQCATASGIGLDQMARELTSAGVAVVSMRKGSDGLARVALCGASTGTTNVFQVDAAAVDKAKALGFAVLATARAP